MPTISVVNSLRHKNRSRRHLKNHRRRSIRKNRQSFPKHTCMRRIRIQYKNPSKNALLTAAGLAIVIAANAVIPIAQNNHGGASDHSVVSDVNRILASVADNSLFRLQRVPKKCLQKSLYVTAGCFALQRFLSREQTQTKDVLCRHKKDKEAKQ